MAGLSQAQLGGYLLEEIIAWMLQSSGYRLLTSSKQDPIELIDGSNGLRVRGRGAGHQADVLGELAYVPPFSLPLRMFVEAKCYKSEKVGLKEVRNAHGVIHDVNQNWTTSARSARPRQRYHYLYSLFSTSGFTKDAQEYAQAHQLVLVDLSAPDFGGLIKQLRASSQEMLDTASREGLQPFPLSWVRATIRGALGTASSDEGQQLTNASLRSGQLAQAINKLTAFVTGRWRSKVLLGFPAAPLILAMFVSDIDATIAALSEDPIMRIHLRHIDATETAGSWIATSQDSRLQFRFTLPDRIETWITEDPDEYRSRRAAFRNDFLSDITVVYSDRGDVRIFKLVYDTSDWRRPDRSRFG